MRVVTGRVDEYDEEDRLAEVDGIPGVIQVMRHVGDVVVGDTAVVVVQGGQAWVSGVLGPVPPPPPPPPTPEEEHNAPQPAPPEPTTLPLRPSWSGTWRAGSWRGDTSDLYQGDLTGRGINTGGCWWGRLPSGMTDLSLQLVRAAGAGSGAAQSPTMALLAGTSRPAGAPTILATTPGPALLRGGQTLWPVPEAWRRQMSAGTAGGIGITSQGSRNPYLALVSSGVGMTLTPTYVESEE